MARILILLGVVFLIAGLVWYTVEKFGLRFPPRLPGDILIRRGNTTIYIPIVTSIIISVVVSLLLYLISKFRL
ncbi:MAG: DUF2905 domain-containing protein [Thermaurantimonas sp.]